MAQQEAFWINKIVIAIVFLIVGMLIMFLLGKYIIGSNNTNCRDSSFKSQKENNTTKMPLITTTTTKPITTTQDPKFSISTLPNDPINFSNWMTNKIKSNNHLPKAWNGNFPNAKELSGRQYKSCPSNEKLCQNKCVPQHQKCYIPTINQINCQESSGYKWCQEEQKCILISENCNDKKSKSCRDPSIIGVDKDSHGCNLSAGYSWCKCKKECTKLKDC